MVSRSPERRSGRADFANATSDRATACGLADAPEPCAARPLQYTHGPARIPPETPGSRARLRAGRRRYGGAGGRVCPPASLARRGLRRRHGLHASPCGGAATSPVDPARCPHRGHAGDDARGRARIRRRCRRSPARSRATPAARIITTCCAARCDTLLHWVQRELPGCRGRGVVDTAPLLERDFARRAGLGWIGKNTMLIRPRPGELFPPRRVAARSRTGGRRPFHRQSLRHLHRLPARLPHRRIPGSRTARRAALHQLSHDRASRINPGDAAHAAGRVGLRLRRLPGGVPVEPQGAGRRRAAGASGPCVTGPGRTAWHE